MCYFIHVKYAVIPHVYLVQLYPKLSYYPLPSTRVLLCDLDGDACCPAGDLVPFCFPDQVLQLCHNLSSQLPFGLRQPGLGSTALPKNAIV